MARRRSYYGTKRKATPRRILLYTAVVVVVLIAAWMLYQEHFSGKAPGSTGDLNIITPVDNRTANNTATPAKKPVTVSKLETKKPTADPIIRNPKPEVAQKAPDTVLPTAAVNPVDSQTAIIMPSDQNTYHPQFAQGMAQYTAGITAMESGKVLQARDLLSKAIGDGLPWETEKQARARLNDLAKLWLFSRNIYDDDTLCELYKVQSGDYLSTIGGNYGIPYQFIMRVNNISKAANLRAGENIKVVHGPFTAVADRTKFILTLYLGDTIAYTWPISTGREGRGTPTGKWMVTKGKKLVNPEWTDPDTGTTFLPDNPENPLGERWIGIHGIEGSALGRTGFGIHGTIEPEKIGQQASRGCIRLRNQDVEVVYDMLAEGQSTVIIQD